MRNEVEVLAIHPVAARMPHALPMPQDAHKSAGFTAVNGENTHKQTSFRPYDDSNIVVATPASRQSLPKKPTEDSSRQNSSRPSDRNDSVLQADPFLKDRPVQAKRKRSTTHASDEPIRERKPTAARSPSPKRSATSHRIQDVVIDEDDDDEEDEEDDDDEDDDDRIEGRHERRRDDDDDRHATPRPTIEPVHHHYSTSSTRLVGANHKREMSPPYQPPDVREDVVRAMQGDLQLHLNASNKTTSPTDLTSPTTPPGGAVATADDDAQDRHDANASDPPAKRKRNFSHRTKSGCHTCRVRKKKCDEIKPTCGNCARGRFVCGGYGVRPPNFKPTSLSANNKPPVPLQAKAAYEHSLPPHSLPPVPPPSQSHPPPAPPAEASWSRFPHHPLPPSEPHRYHPQGQPPTHPPHHYDVHHPRESWHGHNFHDPSIHLHSALPRVDYSSIPPPSFPHFPGEHHPHGPPLDHWASHSYRPPTGPGTTVSSRESVVTSTSQRAAQLALNYGPSDQLTERDKMLIGKPYRHWIDNQLLEDRVQCKAAVERYNRAALPSEALSSDERARFFAAILDPVKRNATAHSEATGALMRAGHIGHRTLVETPFYCDYGYNINIGDDVVIQPGCYMQDPCEIFIGNRSIVGPNVKFYGMTASIDSNSRKGSQGDFIGGAIRVEEDCFIGADVTILPYRIIGKGAVVGAGSVVTKNVPPYTVVAGNPAREIRSLGDGHVGDRRMRNLIQQQNEDMIRDMRARRGYRDV